MCTMLVTALAGMGFLAPLSAIAAAYNRSWAMAKMVDIGPLLDGLMRHMMVSAMFGLIFTLMLRQAFPRAFTLLAAAVAGVAWGLIGAVHQPVHRPAARGSARGDNHERYRRLVAGGWWLVAYLVYAMVLGAIVRATLGHWARTVDRAVPRQVA